MDTLKNILIGLLIIALAAVGYFTFKLNDDFESLKQSLIESEVTHHNYVNGEKVDDDAVVMLENRPWVNYKIVKKYMDENIWLSNSGSRIYIPLETLAVSFENEELDYYIKNKLDAINIPLYTLNEEKYVDLAMLEKLYNVTFDQFNETYLLSVDEKASASLPIGTQIYTLITGGGEAKIVLDKFVTDKEETVHVLNEDKYIKVVFSDGRQGYVSSEDMKNIDRLAIEKNDLGVKRTLDTPEMISLIWDDNLSWEKMFDFYSEEAIEELNVISPVWFNLNVEGIVINSGDLEYTRAAHEKGYQVWGLYKNNFNPDWTNELLSSDQYMEKSIAQLLFYASLYELDGINIDFENVYYDNKDDLTKYMRALSEVLDETDLILSIDVTRPGGSERYSKVIDRQAMNEFMDYFVLMAYDEHWGSSPIAGSVASMEWTKKSIELSLELVDQDKLILGMPLYTRLWKTSGNKVSSKAYSISYIDEVLEGKYFDYKYDESSGQNYLTYEEDGATYQVWAEDKVSLQKRIEMAENFHLPGIAMWRKGYETPYVWELLEKYLE